MQSEMVPPLHGRVSAAAEARACISETGQHGVDLAGGQEIHIYTIHQHPVGLGQPRVPASIEILHQLRVMAPHRGIECLAILADVLHEL